MNKLIKLMVPVLFAISAIGCAKAQPPPSKGYNVVWTWTAPTSGACTTNCSYIISVLTVSSGTTTCPAATGQYIPQQTVATAITVLTFTEQNTTGTLQCAVVSAISGGATSGASGTSNVVTSPPLPLAPGIPSGNQVQQSDLVMPLLPVEKLLVNKLKVSAKLNAPSNISGTVAQR